MDFGIKPIQGGDRFDEGLEQAVLAERMGFDGVYFSQHHGFPDAGYWPDPLLALAGVATRTDSIKLGTALVQLPLENPVTLAGKLAQLDAMSDGRLESGFGLGWRKSEFDAVGVPKAERGQRMTEYLELLDELLRPGPTSFAGDFFELEDFELTPPRVQTPRPSFFVGGKSDQAFERAVTIADGWNPPVGVPLNQLTEFSRQYRDESDGRFILGTEGVVVRENRSDAVAAAKEFIVAQKRPIFEDGDSPYSDLYTDFDSFKSAVYDEFEEYIEDSTFVVGTPDNCIEQLSDMIGNTECDEVIFRASAPEIPVSGSTETIELLGSEVRPSFE